MVAPFPRHSAQNVRDRPGREPAGRPRSFIAQNKPNAGCRSSQGCLKLIEIKHDPTGIHRAGCSPPSCSRRRRGCAHRKASPLVEVVFLTGSSTGIICPEIWDTGYQTCAEGEFYIHSFSNDSIAVASFLDGIPGEDRQKLRGLWEAGVPTGSPKDAIPPSVGF